MKSMGLHRLYRLICQQMALQLIFCLLSSVPALPDKPEAIIIGANNSLTGILSVDAEEQKWAYEQAVSDINAAGGIYVKAFEKKLPVKLIIEDDGSDPGTAALAIEKLINYHKADLLLSTYTTALVVPSCVVAEKYRKYYHANTAFGPPWLAKKFQWSTLLFFDLGEACGAPFKIWESLPPTERPSRPALLMEDSPGGMAFGKEFRKIAAASGYQYIIDEPFITGGGDYTRQLLTLKNANVDAILFFAAPGDTIPFVRQMKEIGLSVKYMHGWKGLWSWKFWKELGPDAQYMICDGFWSETYPYPGAAGLGQKFLDRFKRHSVSIGLFYACCQILWSAIEKAGTLDSAAVRNAVLHTPFTGTVIGDVKYSPEGIAYIQSTANQWVNGQQKMIYPLGQGAAKIKMILPWNERK